MRSRTKAAPIPASAGDTRQDFAEISGGAVLVFLPGTAEIEAVRMALLRFDEMAEAAQAAWVLPLHGSLPAEEQRRVFERAPEGVTKVTSWNVTRG